MAANNKIRYGFDMSVYKIPLDKNVLQAAQERIT